MKVHELFTGKFFGHDELEDVFANIELGNTKTGKLVFLSRLNCLGKEQRRFIRKLSELRNKLVHNIKNARFSLSEYVTRLTVDQYNSFLDDLGIIKKKIESREWVQENAKNLFLAAGIYCLAFIYVDTKTATFKQEAIQKILPMFGLK